MYVKLNNINLTLSTLEEALPARRWVATSEVCKALGMVGEEVAVGQQLSCLGLVRTNVRLGEKTVRVWLIRGTHERDTPAGVKAELVAHGFSHPIPPSRPKARTVRLSSPFDRPTTR